MRIKTPKLYETLIAIGLISVILSMFLAWSLVSSQLTTYFVEDAKKQNIEISTTITTYVEDKLNEAVTHLQLIKESIDLAHMSTNEINALIFRMNQINQSFVDIEVVDSKGMVQYTLPQNSNEIGYDRSREPFFSNFKSDAKIYWSSVQLSPYTNSNTIMIAIHYGDGYLIGYLDLKEIRALSDVYILSFGSTRNITITDQYGIYLVNRDQTLIDERRVDPHHEMELTILNGEYAVIHEESDYETQLITASQIKSNRWIVTISEPYQVAIGGIDYVLKIVIWFAGLMLLAYSFMLWIGSKRVIIEIQSFTKRLVHLSQGLPDESRKGYFKEFEALNESFNLMVDKIDDRDKRLSNLAYNDALTGLRNRAYLDEMLNNWNDLPDQKYTVVYLDLDNFSHVNDTYGHHVGDQLLIKFSFALASTVDHNTDIIHLGGDEFILIIKENIDLNAQTTDIMTKIMSISNEPILCEDRTIYFTLSAGVSYCPKDGQDFWTLLRNADTAMYSAKADGKNTYRYFTREMKLSLEHKLSLEQYLRPAMKKDEFKLEFQPQYSLDGKTIRGFEALARWDSEVLGRISPIDFIAIAEENKMIIPLGQWILRNACETVKLLNKQFNEEFIMAVNVSPVELKEFDYVNSVIRIVKETGIKPQWLEIEITENVSIDAFTRLSATLEKLHEFGISISIDDFGTGYSSLAYLQKIPLDVLKVDRTFITHLGESKDHNLMTETIFLLAKKLGLKTIAEGVETQQHVTFLKGMDCDYIQGYLMSKSLNLQDLIVLINKTNKHQENEKK